MSQIGVDTNPEIIDGDGLPKANTAQQQAALRLLIVAKGGRAFTEIYDKSLFGGGAGIGYQIQADAPADWLWFQPGRFVDAATTYNAACGFRIYEGQVSQMSGWVQQFDTGVLRPRYTGLCEMPAYIPWGGKPCNLFVEFFKCAVSLGAAATLEFVLIPYED